MTGVVKKKWPAPRSCGGLGRGANRSRAGRSAHRSNNTVLTHTATHIAGHARSSGPRVNGAARGRGAADEWAAEWSGVEEGGRVPTAHHACGIPGTVVVYTAEAAAPHAGLARGGMAGCAGWRGWGRVGTEGASDNLHVKDLHLCLAHADVAQGLLVLDDVPLEL